MLGKIVFLCFLMLFAGNTVQASEDRLPDTNTESTESTESKTITTGKVPVFPPLEKPDIEQASNDIWVAIEAIKYRFFEYMESNPDRRKVLKDIEEFKEAIIISYDAFKENPKQFLIDIGVTNPQALDAAEAFRENELDNADWNKTELAQVRILSCKTNNYNTNHSLNAVHIQVPKDYVILDDEKSPLDISFKASDNVKDLKIIPSFPQAADVFGRTRYGYAKTIVIPFTFKAADKPDKISITATVNGTVCNAESCKPISVSAHRTFSVASTLSSSECSFIKDYANRARPLSDIKVNNVYFNGRHLKLEAEFPYNLQNFSILFRNYGDKELKFKKPVITTIGDKIKVIAELDTEKTPPDVLTNTVIQGKKLPVTIGYPEYFAVGDLYPDLIPNTVLKEITAYDAFFTGIKLALLSPLTIMLLFLIRKKRAEYKYILRQVLYAMAVITFIYPVIASVMNWGDQFTNPANAYLGIIVTISATLALIKLPYLKGAGLIFAGIVFAAPCNFLYNLMTYGTFTDFMIAAIGMGIMFAVIFAVKELLADRLPKPLEKLVSVFINDNIFIVFVSVPLIILSLWTMLIIMFEVKLWAFGLTFLLVIIAFRTLQQALTTGKDDHIPAVYLILAAGFIPLFIGGNDTDRQDLLTDKAFNEALAKGQIIYTMADEPWCLSCRLGKLLFLNSKIVDNMIKKNELVVLPSVKDNPKLQTFASLFDVPPIPLNLLYSQTKPNGEILPVFVENYTAKDFIKKVAPPKP